MLYGMIYHYLISIAKIAIISKTSKPTANIFAKKSRQYSWQLCIFLFYLLMFTWYSVPLSCPGG